MNQTEYFRQSDLVKPVGNQNPGGVCLGLTIQWLVAIYKGLSGEEKAFWNNLNSSKANHVRAPRRGMGYAKNAIEYQHKYTFNNNGIGISDYARTILGDSDLTRVAATDSKIYNQTTPPTLSKILLNQSGRYNLLLIDADEGSHVIAIHRKYCVYGKGEEISVFDPNQGRWEACGDADLTQTITHVMAPYQRWSNIHFVLETYS